LLPPRGYIARMHFTDIWGLMTAGKNGHPSFAPMNDRVMPRFRDQSPRFGMVGSQSSVAKNHHVPGGGSGSVPLTSLMMASPSRIADAVATAGSPRAKHRPLSPSIICQDCISFAGISSRFDNASHASRASFVIVATCSIDHESSRKSPQSPHTALKRQCPIASTSHVSLWRSRCEVAASTRCFKKTADTTSNAQKPSPRKSTNSVLDIASPRLTKRHNAKDQLPGRLD
jgi:hypothetical protein